MLYLTTHQYALGSQDHPCLDSSHPSSVLCANWMSLLVNQFVQCIGEVELLLY